MSGDEDVAAEVAEEVEAMVAMYGADCKVKRRFPPNLHIRIKPRTGGVSTEQFVETTIGLRATDKYPDEPPVVSIIDSKGLNDQRDHAHLLSTIRDKALELSSGLMLIVLCEEAVEKLSEMNYPEGDCPMCLCPLYGEEEEDGSPAPPFMKLMSCFHCFHSECILTWYNFLKEKELRKEIYGKRRVRDVKGTCPICRKIFRAKDLEHVIDVDGIDLDRAFSKIGITSAATPSTTAATPSTTAATSSNAPSGSSNAPPRSLYPNRSGGARRFRHAPARR